MAAPRTATLRVFLADLHLNGQDTPRARVFHALLRRLAAEAAQGPVELYILGDLFEFWEEYHRQVAALYEPHLAALEAAYQAGVQVFLLKGNRDFLYGRVVERRFGARLLGDGAAIQLGDSRRVWLEHGDLLCTGDAPYLRYRRIVRGAPARLVYRMLPWFVARRVIVRLAERSRAAREAKPKETFAPDPERARWRLQVQNCQLLLCGHTHAPQATDLGAGYRLLILPAWCETQAGYRELRGALALARFLEDGTAQTARFDGTPAEEG